MIKLGPYRKESAEVLDMMASSVETEKQMNMISIIGRFAQQGSVIRRVMMPYIIGWTLIAGAAALFLLSIHGAFIVLMCFVGVLGYAGAFALAARHWQNTIRQLMDFPIIEASNDHLHIGETIQVRYTHHFKQNTTIETLRLQLVMREWVRYTQGTSTYTDTRDVVMDEGWVDMLDVHAGDTIEREMTLTVPTQAMHTWVMASNNKITWMLKLDVDLPGWLDYKESFGVIVLPEVPHV